MTARTYFLDTETFSTTGISNGTFAYAEAATVELFSFKQAGDQHPARIWEADIDPMPAELEDALSDERVILIAHNVPFDRTLMRIAMGIDIDIRRWRCSMACARSLGLPGGLEKLGAIVGLPEDKQKMKDAHALMMKFCKPAGKGRKAYRYDRTTHPEDWARYMGYCLQDTVALEALWNKLPKWNYTGAELESWFLDQRINDRGVLIDRTFVDHAVVAAQHAGKMFDKRVVENTAGLVTGAGKRDKLLDYLNSVYDLGLTDMKGSTIESLLNFSDDMPPDLRELLMLRVNGTKTSTAKYKKINGAVSSDGYLRGTITWCGASRTGRAAGKTVQPHNFPRPAMKQGLIDLGIEAAQFEMEDILFGDDVLNFYASALRGVFIAGPGEKMPVSDLSNIEGRAMAWAAGEDWKIRAFRDFDAGNGPDLYKLAYAKSFGVEPGDVSKDQRQIGKVEELSMQYYGGVGAFATFAIAYSIDLDDMADKAWPAIPAFIMGKAEGAWEWAVEKKRTYDMSQRSYVACDAIKRMWRMAHPAIVNFWYAIDLAFRSALAHPGETFDAGVVSIRYVNPWIAIRLPSGRLLTYYQPKVLDDDQLSYMGINQFTKKWQRIKTYSGKLAENLIQAISRDVLYANMQPIENAGYKIRLTVHDEVITTCPNEDRYGVDEVSALLATVPVWAPGLPLAAAGFTTDRYRKD